MEKLNNFFTEEEIIKYNLNNEQNSDKIIEILEQINCDNKDIRHIIKSNPKCLKNDYLNVLKLIKKLYEIGITELNILFEENPYLLNKHVFEIEEFINEKTKEKMSLEEIKNIIVSNSYILDEE